MTNLTKLQINNLALHIAVVASYDHGLPVQKGLIPTGPTTTLIGQSVQWAGDVTEPEKVSTWHFPN